LLEVVENLSNFDGIFARNLRGIKHLRCTDWR